MRLSEWRRRRKLASLPFEARIALEARRLQDEQGISAVAALAAAEAVELGRQHSLLFDRVEFDDAQLLWRAVYESRDGSLEIVFPLAHATEATQTGIGSLN